MQEKNIDSFANKKLEELYSSTDKKLVELSGGPQAEPAQAELTRRLMNSINDLNKQTSRYSNVIILLTVVMFVVGFMQLAVSMYSAWGIWVGAPLIIAVFVLDYIAKIVINRQNKF